MIQEFKLIVSNGSNNLCSLMNLYSKEGWTPQRGHQVTHYLDRTDKEVFQYTQMMVREVTDNG